MTLEVRGLSAWRGRARILHDLSFSVAAGEAVALLGRNGAGKTSTLGALMGLIPETRGDARFNGVPILGLPSHRIARLGVGYVPEDRRIFTDLTVNENLAVGRRPPRPGVPVWTIERLVTLFPSLAGLRDRRGGQMSGGEQQMLTIARTLMGNPSLVLLDDPSEGLAPRVVDHMIQALRSMKTEGVGLLLSDQSLTVARHVCDRAIVIEKGRLVHDGSVAALDADPALHGAFLAL
ncbi:ABC transporter ATP-binding protein [Roseospira visakhapatnamensis]|uniref:Branched-chain amino acid transport system ATP-binding protein n=1 Tax=Roseospira visakhapatnamensis TaxID=390880 RepID=A0A7W6WBK6_9PROT|nr:ABC transporter ATP-binding protein [Roseospira visakhapatnamensis]MBB4267933.1 branched-chain amino acid transport system ATP-binding protein [Roseospira visakhapatnamensis]